MTFGEQLKTLREEAKMTQSDLATQSGLSIDSLRKWEQNKMLPKIDSVVRLAKALGAPLESLVSGVKEWSNPKATGGRRAKKK